MLYRHVPPHLAFCYLNNVSFWSPANDILILHKTKESDVLIIWQLSTLRDLCAVAYIHCTLYVCVNRGFYICNICICIYVIIVWILRYFYTYQQTLLLCLYEWLNSINFHTFLFTQCFPYRVFCVCFTLKSIVLKFYRVHVPCLFSCQLTLCLLAKFYSSDGGFC